MNKIIIIVTLITIISLASLFFYLQSNENTDKSTESILRPVLTIEVPYDPSLTNMDFDDFAESQFKKHPMFSGYRGATFDGQNVYFAPYQSNHGRHGLSIFYNTELPFTDPNSWYIVNLGSIGGEGFQGALYHENYVYYVPYFINDNNISGSHVYRYNTNMNWDDISSYDAMGFFGAYEDGVVADGFVYFSPHLDKTGNSNTIPLRYDTSKPFSDLNSWEEIQLDKKSSYIGAAFDGRYIYYSPYFSENDLPTPIMIYDTTKEFKNKDSWEFIPLEQSGYSNAGFNGTHVIFASKHIANNIMFLNTDTRELSFYNTNSIGYQGVIETDNATYLVPYGIHSVKANAEVIEITNSIKTFTPKIAIGGYWGGAYDGRYVYFTPYANGTIMHGDVLRYDTSKPFDNDASWDEFSFSDINVKYVEGKTARIVPNITVPPN